MDTLLYEFFREIMEPMSEMDILHSFATAAASARNLWDIIKVLSTSDLNTKPFIIVDHLLSVDGLMQAFESKTDHILDLGNVSEILTFK